MQDGVDQGIHVREKARQLVELLTDEVRLQEVRAKTRGAQGVGPNVGPTAAAPPGPTAAASSISSISAEDVRRQQSIDAFNAMATGARRKRW